MKLKPITFREALVVLSEGGKIYLDPADYKNPAPIYLNEKDSFQNIGYMALVDFPFFNWHVEDDDEMVTEKIQAVDDAGNVLVSWTHEVKKEEAE